MSQALSLSTRPGDFLPAIGKNGKVSATAEKVAQTLNSMSDRAIVGAAIDGKGSIGKQAREALKGAAVTLNGLLSLSELDGSQWGDLFGLLRACYGVADYNRATQRGRAGAVAYLAAVRVGLVQRFDRAETMKAQDNAYKALQLFDVTHAKVLSLNAHADAAAVAAREAATAALDAPTEQAPTEQAEA